MNSKFPAMFGVGLLSLIFIGVIAFFWLAFKFDAKAPCEAFSDTGQMYIPARCLRYFKN